MNIQIFGSKKDNNTKKAQRFFKERGIRFQYIDLREKTMSKGEFRSVAAVNGGLEGMINKECKDQDALALVTYIAEEDKMDKIPEYLEQKYCLPPFDSERVQNDELTYWYTFLQQTDHIPAKIAEAMYCGETTEDYTEILDARKLCRKRINEIEAQYETEVTED